MIGVSNMVILIYGTAISNVLLSYEFVLKSSKGSLVFNYP